MFWFFSTLAQPESFHIAMAQSRFRLAPDPSVAVSDLAKCFHEVTEKHHCKDLQKLLKPDNGSKPTWKSAPDGEWLAQPPVSDLYKLLFGYHQNGVLSGKKLQQALLKGQNDFGRMNFGKLHDTDWADSLDSLIRIGASHLRDLKKEHTKYARCAKKLGVEEKERLDEVLALMRLDTIPQTDNSSTQARAREAEEEPQEGDVLKHLVIFDKVLQKQSSDPVSPVRPSKVPTGSSTDKREGGGKAVLKLSVSAKFEATHEAFDQKETAEFQAWMLQTVSVPEKKQNKKTKPKKTQHMKKPASGLKKKEQKNKFAQAVYKSCWKRRKKDSAYHQARSKALKAGLSPEEAAEKAREASQKVAQQIAAGTLTEEK